MQGYDFNAIDYLVSINHHFPQRGVVIATRDYSEHEKIEERLFLLGVHLDLIMDPRIRSAWSSRDQQVMFKIRSIMDKGIDEFHEADHYQYKVLETILDKKGYKCLLHLQRPERNNPQKI